MVIVCKCNVWRVVHCAFFHNYSTGLFSLHSMVVSNSLSITYALLHLLRRHFLCSMQYTGHAYTPMFDMQALCYVKRNVDNNIV